MSCFFSQYSFLYQSFFSFLSFLVTTTVMILAYFLKLCVKTEETEETKKRIFFGFFSVSNLFSVLQEKKKGRWLFE